MKITLVKRFFSSAALSVTVAWAPVGAGAASEADTAATMRQLLGALQVLLPAAIEDGGLRRPGAAEPLQSMLRLAELSAGLEQHFDTADAGLTLQARALARHSAQLSAHYRAGWDDPVRRQILRLVDYCASCHAQVPAAGAPASRVEPLVNEAWLQRLPALHQAKVYVATRRFDRALAVLENLLADPAVRPSRLTGRAVLDYLLLSIRVKGDLARPAASLRAFLQRPQLAPVIRDEAWHWLRTLDELASQPQNQSDGLARAQDLIQAARAYNDTFPMDRRPLVYYIAASAEALRFLRATPDGEALRAARVEAYYLLGLAEYRIGGGFLMTQQADIHLETAIRLAPGSAYAGHAYALLEEETVAAFSGSSGTHLPEDIRQHLDELRALATRDY